MIYSNIIFITKYTYYQMVNWYYKVRKYQGKRLCDAERCILIDGPPMDDVIPFVYKSLLDKLRTDRFTDLLYDVLYDDRSDDEHSPYCEEVRFETLDRFDSELTANRDVTIARLRENLPLQYKPYANDLNKLKDEMASLYEVSELYEVCDVEPAPNCYGCLYDCPGQRDHMECPTGCLYDDTMSD